MSSNLAGRLVLPALLLAGCAQAQPVVPATQTAAAAALTSLNGDSQSFYGQTVTTWASQNADNAIKEVGMTLPAAAVDAAPTDKTAPNTEVTFKVPDVVKAQTFINHLEVDFKPNGHPPTQYQVGHFEFDAVSIDEDEVEAIDCKNATVPDPSRIPDGFALLPAPGGKCFAKTGTYATNQRAPENQATNPAKFTTSFQLGYYAGSLLFLEPEATREVMAAHQSFSMPIPAPAKLGKSTLYPGTFTATYDDASKAYKLVWSDFKSIN